jgi:hypothetical protein
LPHLGYVLTDEKPGPEQIAALRAMTGVQRLKMAEQLYWLARKIKLAGLRNQHPDWSDARLNEELIRVFTRATS